uniref:Uncharacterized protein n=1 Tax=Noctiluca scintillans TaxID=2966 RepID=A0A7S1ARZ8_NOCSC|mmetsp:Transcript_57519/g.153251  ORF Transcript_57519/g.153251 Transcript_57519/m.153251 type:complete len:245 (+) Transcript_57519:169-903(+)
MNQLGQQGTNGANFVHCHVVSGLRPRSPPSGMRGESVAAHRSLPGKFRESQVVMVLQLCRQIQQRRRSIEAETACSEDSRDYAASVAAAAVSAVLEHDEIAGRDENSSTGSCPQTPPWALSPSWCDSPPKRKWFPIHSPDSRLECAVAELAKVEARKRTLEEEIQKMKLRSGSSARRDFQTGGLNLSESDAELRSAHSFGEAVLERPGYTLESPDDVGGTCAFMRCCSTVRSGIFLNNLDSPTP